MGCNRCCVPYARNISYLVSCALCYRSHALTRVVRDKMLSCDFGTSYKKITVYARV